MHRDKDLRLRSDACGDDILRPGPRTLFAAAGWRAVEVGLATMGEGARFRQIHHLSGAADEA
jgi:hypothetical protein